MRTLWRYRFWVIIPVALFVLALVLLVVFGGEGDGQRLYPRF